MQPETAEICKIIEDTIKQEMRLAAQKIIRAIRPRFKCGERGREINQE